MELAVRGLISSGRWTRWCPWRRRFVHRVGRRTTATSYRARLRVAAAWDEHFFCRNADKGSAFAIRTDIHFDDSETGFGNHDIETANWPRDVNVSNFCNMSAGGCS